MTLSITLALRELRHDWQAAACFVAALVGVLAPLLIILALKNGVITTMLGRLVDDPANREIIAVGAGRHDADFFADLAARPDVAFVVPATRSINAVANAVRHKRARTLERKVVLIPSAAADPLNPNSAVAPGSVTLSRTLADALEARAGDVLEIRIERRIDGIAETATRELSVTGIVPEEGYSRSAMFIALPDLLYIERFRDDVTVSAQSWTTPRQDPATYASFRLYAATLADISRLDSLLAGSGIAARPRVENVALLLSFKRNLDLLFIGIAALAVAGFWAAMAANLRGSVERQRTSLSLLRLLGLPEVQRRLIPTAQSIALVTGGVLLTLVLVLPALAIINLFFTPAGFDRIAWLGPRDVMWAIFLGLITAVTASMWATFAIGDIGADDVLHAH